MSADGATVLPKGHSEDAFLLQKKQIPLETRRISDIVERCISQVEIAASLPGIIQFCEASGVMDTDLNKALQAHELLGERVEKLEGLTSESDEKLNEEDEERRRRKRVQLGKDIKNSVRDVLRVFKSNPNAFFDLRAKLALEVGESERTLIKALKMFHSHVVETFLPSEERKLSNQPSSTPNKGLAHLILKEEELTAVLKQQDKEVSSGLLETNQPEKVEIPEMESEIKSMQRYLKEDFSNEIDRPPVRHEQDQPNKRLIRLQQETDQQTIQINNLMLENGKVERIVREKTEMLEMETENLLVKFDEKMKEIQAKLEVNQSAHEKEQGELKELKKPFAVLEVEFNRIQEKRRLAEEKKMQEMRDLELKTKAAIIIQAWWRDYITRKALKNKGKSKKTKKGKGKKSR